MKNIYLSLVVLCFSSLLIGCGMKGPLYQKAPQQETKTQQSNETETTTDALNNSQ